MSGVTQTMSGVTRGAEGVKQTMSGGHAPLENEQSPPCLKNLAVTRARQWRRSGGQAHGRRTRSSPEPIPQSPGCCHRDSRGGRRDRLGGTTCGSPSLSSAGSPPLGSPGGMTRYRRRRNVGSPSVGSPSAGSPPQGSPGGMTRYRRRRNVGSPSVGSPSAGSPSSVGSPSVGRPSAGHPGGRDTRKER